MPHILQGKGNSMKISPTNPPIHLTLPFHSVIGLMVNGVARISSKKSENGEGYVVQTSETDPKLLKLRTQTLDALVKELKTTGMCDERAIDALTTAVDQQIRCEPIYDTRFKVGKKGRNSNPTLPTYFGRQTIDRWGKPDRDHLVPRSLAGAWQVAERGSNNFEALNPETMAKNVSYGYVRKAVKRLSFIVKASGDARNPEAVQFLRNQKLEALLLCDQGAEKLLESKLVGSGKSTHIARKIAGDQAQKAQTTIETINGILNNTSLRAAMAIWKNDQELTAKAQKAKAQRDNAQRDNAASTPPRKARRDLRGTEPFNTMKGLGAVKAATKRRVRASTSTLVNVNTANAAELRQLKGIGPKTAEAVIAKRPYTSVSHFIGNSKVRAKLADLICV